MVLTKFEKKLNKAIEGSKRKWNEDIYPLIFNLSRKPCPLCQLFPSRLNGKCVTTNHKKVCPITDKYHACCIEWTAVNNAIRQIISRLNSATVV